MSYNEELLKEFIHISISSDRIDERITSGDAEVETDWEAKFTPFDERWGAAETHKRCAKSECGILHDLGMLQSTWEWPSKMKDFFVAWRDLATVIGQKFLKLLEKTVNPSPGSEKNWAFPKSQKFLDKATGKGPEGRFSWGKSKTPTRSPLSLTESLYGKNDIFVNHMLYEGAGDSDFLEAFASDLTEIVSFVESVKTASNVIDAVSTWNSKVETEGSVSQLASAAIEITDRDLNLSSMLSGLITEVLVPYVKEMLENVPKRLSEEGIPKDLLPQVEQMVQSAARKI